MSFLSSLAAEHDATQAQRAAKKAARSASRAGGSAATALDPERCKSVGRTLTRPAWWPDEEPSWPPIEPDGIERPSHKPTTGKRSGGWCPECREQRSRTGECWCGSDERAVTRHGNPIGGGRTHRSRSLPPEAQGPAWAAAHRLMHPRPLDGCARCIVAHDQEA